MSEECVGVVTKVYEKGGRHSIIVNDEWYGLGYEKPNISEGYTVKFNWEANGQYKNIIKGTLKAKPGEAVATPAAGKRVGAAGKSDYAKKEQYWADKETRDIETQKRISYQAAMNTAIAMVTSAAQLDCLALPKSKKAADKFEAFTAMVEEEASRIFASYQTLPDRAEDIVNSFSEPEASEPDVDVVEEEDDGEWE